MKRRIMVSVVVAGTVVTTGIFAALIGRSAWKRETARAVAALPDAAGAVHGVGPGPEGAFLYSEAGLDEPLPEPVARYFALVLPEGQPRIRSARIEWAGEFQMRPGGGWVTFEAIQHFTSRPPGFVWDAKIGMIPLVPVNVRDSYLSGTGTMRARLGGLVNMVDAGGMPEMAQSALARWVGEAVWLPTALLPGGGVRWKAVDDNTARVIVEDGSVSASAEFTFAPTGEVTRMTAIRYRDVEGTPVPTEFEGLYFEYVRHDGILVPASAEVAWLLPEGRYAYWRGWPEAIEYVWLSDDR